MEECVMTSGKYNPWCLTICSYYVVRIGKGDTILIPILALNSAKHIWGEDAAEFKYVEGNQSLQPNF